MIPVIRWATFKREFYSMKTILVLTDFSINADYMADYALALAQHISANLLLCNVYERPAGEPVPDSNAWPRQACEANSINDLGALMARLKTKLDKYTSKGYKPEIDQCSVDGTDSWELSDIVTRHHVFLVMISAHCRHNDGGLFQKNHAWQIIEQAAFPVMVIPYQTRFAPYQRISFSTAIQEADNEVLLALNISYPKFQDSAYKDLFILAHHKQNFLQNIFSPSLTRKMAAHPRKPLLIFSKNVIN